jgi:CubicO group peptidase (beta-lactamase class C family)
MVIALPAAAAAGDDSDAANQRAQALLREQMRSRRIPGLQAAVVHKGRLALSFADGFANVEHRVPVRATTLFPLNSITKAFTAVAIMQLVEAGKVSLDAPIATYLDGLPPSWQPVLVRHLLAHLSGLPDVYGEEGVIGGGGEQEAWAAVRALPLQAPPGERAAYNQTNYLLLGRMIDRLAGMPFTRFIGERQFARTGLDSARFGDTFDVIPDSAQSYSYRRLVKGKGEVDTGTLNHWVDDIPPFLRSASGTYATAEGFAGWILALQRGSLMSASSKEALWAPQPLKDGTFGPWTLGWLQMGTATQRAIGGIGGGRSAFAIYPDHDISVMILTNLAGADPQAFLHDVARLYVPELLG